MESQTAVPHEFRFTLGMCLRWTFVFDDACLHAPREWKKNVFVGTTQTRKLFGHKIFYCFTPIVKQIEFQTINHSRIQWPAKVPHRAMFWEAFMDNARIDNHCTHHEGNWHTLEYEELLFFFFSLYERCLRSPFMNFLLKIKWTWWVNLFCRNRTRSMKMFYFGMITQWEETYTSDDLRYGTIMWLIDCNDVQ